MKNWFLFLIQGLLGVIFGALIIIWPIKSLVALTWFLGAFLLLEGIVVIFAAFLSPKESNSFTGLFLHGIFSLAMGFILFAWPESTLKIIYFFFALWALVIGIIKVVGAIGNKEDRGSLLLTGLISVFFGVLLLSYPVFTVGFSQLLFGFVILLNGFATTIHSFKLRSANK